MDPPAPPLSSSPLVGDNDTALTTSLHKKHSSLQRNTSQPTTSAEMEMISAKSHEKMRLKSLSTIRKLRKVGREGIGSIITDEELMLLESTIAVSVRLR